MSNLLENYLNERITKKEGGKMGSSLSGGPVITISREVGCNAVMLAELIAARLNSKKTTKKWKVISKEVFYESARELDMDPKKIIKLLHQSEKFAFEEMIKSFSNKDYKSERKIKKTVKEVILHLANEGHYIMVGGAVHIIAKDVKKSLDIMLVAPLEYRVDSIMQNNKLNKEDALDYIKCVDKERIAYRKALLKDDPQNEIFDIILNRAVFTDEEIVDIIEYTAMKKNII